VTRADSTSIRRIGINTSNIPYYSNMLALQLTREFSFTRFSSNLTLARVKVRIIEVELYTATIATLSSSMVMRDQSRKKCKKYFKRVLKGNTRPGTPVPAVCPVWLLI